MRFVCAVTFKGIVSLINACDRGIPPWLAIGIKQGTKNYIPMLAVSLSSHLLWQCSW